MRHRFLLLLLSIVLGSTSGRGDFDAWADDFAARWLRLNPQAATSAQFFTGAEQDALDRELTPVTAEHLQRRVALARQGLEELAQHSRAGLTEDQAISAAMLQWQLEQFIASSAFEPHTFVFEQFRGLQLNLVNFLTRTHPIRNARDVENYLARLAQVPLRLEEGMVEARRAGADGFIPPRFILERTLHQIDLFLQPSAADNALVTTLAERTAQVEGLAATERDAAAQQAEQRVLTAVLPAYRQVQELLREHLPHSDDRPGLWRLRDGDAAYRQALVVHTSTRLSANEIHAIGIREVARIEAEMDRILETLGYVEGTVEERFTALNLAVQPPADPDPRPDLIVRYTEMTRDAEHRAAAVFDLRPRAPIEVRRVPEFMEATAAAHYVPPAPDGSRPGVFYAPLPGPTFGILRMRSLTYHEAVPGHHFQIALQQEMEHLPRFRRDRLFAGTTAYVEGWALYAERLADELGWYKNDPHGRLGYLHSELFRARRLVVDTGLHAKQWTRQQAIDYGISAREVERYVVLPGQACAYMIGLLHILELREQAQQRLGEGFSLREFHNVVLRTGAVPLDVLTEVIDQWVAKRAAREGPSNK